MGTLYSPRFRVERVITAGRAVLAAFFLLAIWLDPSEPARYARMTYGILACYLGYALALASMNWLMGIRLLRFQIVAHVFDLLVFVLLMFLTRGPTSPFFVYFIFSLVCAELLWQWRGTLWTAIGALIAVISTAIYPNLPLDDPDFELNRFIIRVIYLAVVAIMLAFLGAHEQRLRGELSKLAAWPSRIPEDLRSLVREMLERCGDILDAKRVLLVWEEGDEPLIHLAAWSSEDFRYSRRPHAGIESLVAAPLVGKSFFCQDAMVPRAEALYESPAGLKRWEGTPFDPRFRKDFNIRAAIAVRLQGEKLQGYLLALDRPNMTADDLLLGGIVAQQVRTRLENFLLLKQLQRAAAGEERIRLARDLHDGVLQFLTGVKLQIETACRTMGTDAPAARQRLEELQRLIAEEQQDLRSHIRGLKSPLPGVPEMDVGLAGRLEELAGRVQRRWGLHVEVNSRVPEARLSESLAREIYFIVHESVSNAAKHASASAVTVELALDGDCLHIRVTDDGRGFPFRGRYGSDDLARLNLGPATLRERISAIRGALAIESGESGASLEITLPITEKES